MRQSLQIRSASNRDPPKGQKGEPLQAVARARRVGPSWTPIHSSGAATLKKAPRAYSSGADSRPEGRRAPATVPTYGVLSLFQRGFRYLQVQGAPHRAGFSADTITKVMMVAMIETFALERR